MMKKLIYLFCIALLAVSCNINNRETPGHTIITKWQGDKRAAVSITYDDGSINQFRVARPVMNRLGMPGTFFINSGKVKGSAKGKFLGRSPEQIIKETSSIPTNQDNFFERASLIRFTALDKAVDYHTRAGSLFETGKVKEAWALMDEAFGQVRAKRNYQLVQNLAEDSTTWEEYRQYVSEGHEIANHTITHPKLAVLDEANLLYELEQGKADIEKNLGKRSTFSGECPYGTENERVMEYAHKIHPALRNRMPEPWLDELNRASKKQPGECRNEYVQWQRGPVRKISMQEMKSYVDTCMTHRNIWLVLVFHGIDGIGWEPRTGAEIEEYFTYIKNREPYLWVATFGDVAKYMKERKNAAVTSAVQGDSILVNISSTLDPRIYDVPITFKTYLPGSWKSASRNLSSLQIQRDSLGSFVLYPVKPGEGEVVLKKK